MKLSVRRRPVPIEIQFDKTEVYSAKIDANNNPITGADGFYVPDQLLRYTAMEREAGWGDDIPELLRNENWNYAIFTTAKKYQQSVKLVR